MTKGDVERLIKVMVIYVLVEIINAIMLLEYFLIRGTTEGVIIALKANKALRFLKNYRPINIFSNISKLTENVIISRLRSRLVFVLVAVSISNFTDCWRPLEMGAPIGRGWGDISQPCELYGPLRPAYFFRNIEQIDSGVRETHPAHWIIRENYRSAE